MTIRNLASAVLLTAISFPAIAQTQWTVQGANINNPSACVADISAVSDTVAWAISTVLDPGSGACGIPTTNFTRTVNGGATWQAGVIGGLPASYTPTSIYAVDGQTAWITAFDLFNYTSGRIYKTTNGGSTWVQQMTPPFPDPARLIHFFNASEGVVVGDSSVFRTTNGGTTWVAGGLPVPFNMATEFLLNSDEIVGNTIWLGDIYGDFYKSTNRGQSWVRLQQINIADAIKGIAFKDTMNGVAIGAHFVQGGNGGGAYTDDSKINRTSDGGVTWTTSYIFFSNFMINTNAAKYDVAYVPGTANTYILTQEYGLGTNYSAISHDGGMTWQPIDSNIKHTVLAFGPNGKGWSGGYYTSPNAGMFRWGSVPNVPTSVSETVVAASNKVDAYPNPVKGQLQVGFAQPLSNVTITVTDVSGKILSMQKIGSQPVRQTSVATDMLPTGTYFLNVEAPTGRLTSKFVK